VPQGEQGVLEKQPQVDSAYEQLSLLVLKMNAEALWQRPVLLPIRLP